MTGTHQQSLGTGGGDIGQPVLGQQLLAAELLLVVAHSGVRRLYELRNRSGVSAQIRRQDRGVHHPVVGDSVTGENPFHERRQEDGFPLQALCLVHSEELDRIAVGGNRLLEPRTLIALSLEIPQKPGQRGFSVHVDIGSDRIQERADLVPPGGSGATPEWPSVRHPSQLW